jgi:hypothetical protein
MSTVPADLFVKVCEALEAAEGELTMIEDCGVPASDALTEALRRQEIGEAVLRRIMRAAPPERRRRLGAMCREERVAHRYVNADAMIDGPHVMPEIKRELQECRETIERRAISDPGVAQALREVLPKGWAW